MQNYYDIIYCMDMIHCAYEVDDVRIEYQWNELNKRMTADAR